MSDSRRTFCHRAAGPPFPVRIGLRYDRNSLETGRARTQRESHECTRHLTSGMRATRCCAADCAALFVVGTVGAKEPEANRDGPSPASQETLDAGRELFARAWAPKDPRSHGGDGLGPVFNAQSCLDCHDQGGPGGAGPAERNIEIATATGGAIGGFRLRLCVPHGLRRGAVRVLLRHRRAEGGSPRGPGRSGRVGAIHPGFRAGRSVVLHRFGTDPEYQTWRAKVPGRRGAVRVEISQRNPTPLFGTGLIDAIPDEAIEAAARRRTAGASGVRGRVARLKDGAGRPLRLEGADGDARGVRPLGRRQRGRPGGPRPPPGRRPAAPGHRRGGPGHGPGRVRRPGGLRAGPAGAGGASAGRRQGGGADRGGRGDLRRDRLRGVPSAEAGGRRGDLQRPPAARHGPEAGGHRLLRRLRREPGRGRRPRRRGRPARRVGRGRWSRSGGRRRSGACATPPPTCTTAAPPRSARPSRSTAARVRPRPGVMPAFPPIAKGSSTRSS